MTISTQNLKLLCDEKNIARRQSSSVSHPTGCSFSNKTLIHLPHFVIAFGRWDEVFNGDELRWNFFQLPQPLLQTLSRHYLSARVHFLFLPRLCSAKQKYDFTKCTAKEKLPSKAHGHPGMTGKDGVISMSFRRMPVPPCHMHLPQRCRSFKGHD